MTTRRPDASMALLNGLVEHSLDPEYRPGARSTWRSKVSVLLVSVLCGVLMGSYALTSGVNAASKERSELIAQIEDARQTNDELLARISTEHEAIEQLQPEPQSAGKVTTATVTAVSGPGVVVTLKDSSKEEIVDEDLRQVANGLWQAGAEAIAINGHRLSAHTSIRQAGGAITVDYRSLSSPYVVEAIGDPSEMNREFATNSGGVWLNFLKQNYQVEWSWGTRETLTLEAADAHVSRARKG